MKSEPQLNALHIIKKTFLFEKKVGNLHPLINHSL